MALWKNKRPEEREDPLSSEPRGGGSSTRDFAGVRMVRNRTGAHPTLKGKSIKNVADPPFVLSPFFIVLFILDGAMYHISHGNGNHIFILKENSSNKYFK